MIELKQMCIRDRQSVVYADITFVDTVRIDSNPANLTCNNCKFENGFRMPHSVEGANVTVNNCKLSGNADEMCIRDSVNRWRYARHSSRSMKTHLQEETP